MPKQNYKQLSAELDQVMSQLEGGDVDIDDAVKCYERGLTIVRELEAHLRKAENKVVELKASVIFSDEDEE